MNGPQHYREAEQLLMEAARSTETTFEGANPLADRDVAAAQVHATLALAAATAMQATVVHDDGPEHGMGVMEALTWYETTGVGAARNGDGMLTVYRASHESIVMGLYLTEAAAREHCEQVLSDEHPPTAALVFDWIGDEVDPREPMELVVQVGDGDEQVTGYVVTPLPVASEYDPEAEA